MAARIEFLDELTQEQKNQFEQCLGFQAACERSQEGGRAWDEIRCPFAPECNVEVKYEPPTQRVKVIRNARCAMGTPSSQG